MHHPVSTGPRCPPSTCVVHHQPALCTMVHKEDLCSSVLTYTLIVNNVTLYRLGGVHAQDDYACSLSIFFEGVQCSVVSLSVFVEPMLCTTSTVQSYIVCHRPPSVYMGLLALHVHCASREQWYGILGRKDYMHDAGGT